MKAKPTCLVRRGHRMAGDELAEWNTEVVRRLRRHKFGDWNAYSVVLTHPQASVIVADFDVHCGRYESEEEETSVSLSAIGCACSTAAILDSLQEDWQLRHHIPTELLKCLSHEKVKRNTHPSIATAVE